MSTMLSQERIIWLQLQALLWANIALITPTARRSVCVFTDA